MDIQKVLQRAWRGGFSTKSDFARRYANEVAACASLGYITTKVKRLTYGNQWFITNLGLEVLDECYS
jgi:hypothetical protein